MNRRALACIWLLSLFACGGVRATPGAPHLLEAHVVKVNDGDSLEIRDSNNLVHRVRLAGIDAPEYDQPFGSRARESLSRLVLDKDARLEIQKRDGYGRLVAKVWVVSPDAPCTVP